MTGLTNGTPLRVIRRKDRINWCIPFTYFLEDTELRKQVNDETRPRQESLYLVITKQNIAIFMEKKPTPIHTQKASTTKLFL